MKTELQDLHDRGFKKVVLSTTGNVGISASQYGSELGMEVICMMSEKGDMKKAAQIQKAGGKLCLSDRPVRWASYLSRKYDIPLLKGSKSDGALDGYESLGREIVEQAPDVDAIVNFCSSGTSTLGIAQAYERSARDLPAFHVVQSGKSSSIVRELNPDQIREEEVENGVGLESTPRKQDLLQLIENSDGDAWYVSPDELDDVKTLLESEDLQVSWESQASILIAQRLLKENVFYQHVLVIVSGKQWPNHQPVSPGIIHSLTDADRVMNP